ncbi:membrane protein [Sporolactobacillus laevolacticus]|uniref:Membrane protein n=1 Tax=Sporolactobacillus laevolacticus DSM 442 TaxID=1395513 RepID=V6IVJ6_9BACL|nr:membrane protein [Sporolactobacillus laevolacticus]EST11172.1 membrane protein [Sporolactobacillus laevolacticus DSM 442]
MNRLATTLPHEQSIFSKVPEITAYFWIAKLLTTGMGEVFSDYLVKQINPIIAVALGGVGLVAAMVLQFMVKRYVAWIYWLVVVMVSIFGTMAADVVHVVLGIPYTVSTLFFSGALAIIFITWYKIERTLSIHSIYTVHREAFYWITVLGTFALGTASGDMTATTLHLGYFSSGILFAVLLAVPALYYWRFKKSAIFSFWFAYIMTRPVGASFSDWLSKPHSLGGLAFGEGQVSLSLTMIIIVLVVFLQTTRIDVKSEALSPQIHS